MLPPSNNTCPWKLHITLMHSSNTISWSHAEHHWGYSNQFLKLRFADFQTAFKSLLSTKKLGLILPIIFSTGYFGDGEERQPRSENQVGDL
ncbi:unnamed protein product [Sphagnum jensenii]|uniref:Uncharacterized protein n=1 Tax=Sphagnum jensenii TaxID=128206 RepID=A0ABP1BCL7_9BRYO